MVQEAADHYMRQIQSCHDNSQLGMPKELHGKSMITRLRKEAELVETSVTSAIYMFADASEKRTILLAKILLLIFLHDGMCLHFALLHDQQKTEFGRNRTY